jgi:hypothetical protein
MSTTFHAPNFIPPHEEQAVGVDYLGVRAINLAMMSTLIPAVNNAVDSVRPFSLLSWIAWRHEGALAASGETPSEARLKSFREKVEALFVWSHVQKGAGAGMAGMQQKVPSTPKVKLSFASFKRNERDEGFIGAPQYGPGLRFPFGFGFTYHEKKLFKATHAGEQMAMAFDDCLRARLSPAQYEFLASLDETEIDNVDHVDFFEAWHVDRPSEVEKRVFTEQLYRKELLGEDSVHGRRSAFLHVARAIVENSADPLTTAALRQRLATQPLPEACLTHACAGQFALVKRRWQLMQVRQAQRLALESLFGWVERCLLNETASSVEDLVALAGAALTVGSDADQYLEGLLESFRTSLEIDGLFADFQAEPERLDIFQSMTRLEKTASEPGGAQASVVVQAVALLAQCAVMAAAFKRDAVLSTEVSAGLPHRLPLGLWATLVERYATLSLNDFLRKLFGTHIISQHFSIAASRSSDERSRLRIGNEDRGLTSLLTATTSALSPNRTEDRLESALALMSSCGLIAADAPTRTGGPKTLYRSNQSTL